MLWWDVRLYGKEEDDDKKWVQDGDISASNMWAVNPELSRVGEGKDLH